MSGFGLVFFLISFFFEGYFALDKEDHANEVNETIPFNPRDRFRRQHNHANMDPEKLKLHQERAKAHEEYMKQHEGHDDMHAEMLLILFVVLMLSQVILLVWKRNSPRTFHNFTLLGLWLIPAAYAISYQFWRFVLFWTAFSILNSYIIYKASRQPLAQGTPRLVYKWFYLLFYACYFLGISSSVLIMLDIFGLVGLFFDSVQFFQIFIIVLYYALYFGVLGRDFADMCSDRMASTLGFYSKEGITTRTLSSNTCAVCSNPLFQMIGGDSNALEKTIKLDCNHSFHEWCIRGWCLIGKKHTCPFCKEKVDLAKFANNPWEQANVRYSSLLDGLRYLLVWHPIIVLIVRGIIYELDLK